MLRVVTNEVEATRLAELLNGHGRDRPVVVVSTPSGRGDPWIDAEEIEAQLGNLAEVYVVPTGSPSWAFSERMPSGTQVYGGAGRAYPIGHGWVGNLNDAPLRFAYDADEGARATRLLIDDALAMAASAGLFEGRHEVTRERRRGLVKGVVADRALIDIEGHLASVAPALAFPGVPLERVLAKGMVVEGWWDPNANWFDVRAARRDPVEALGEYAVGDVVLAVVRDVGPDSALLYLHPLVEVSIERSAVTSNPIDEVKDLMSPGEVLPVRVVATQPAWRLSMLDLDDEEPIRTAICLMPGGPAWLLPPEVDQLARAAPQPIEAVAAPEPGTDALAVEKSLALMEKSLAAVETRIATTDASEPTTDSSPRPTPLLLTSGRRSPFRPLPTSPPTREPRGAAVQTMSLTIATLKTQLVQLRQELDPMRDGLRGLQLENAELAAEVAHLRCSVEHQQTLLQHSRSRLRKAGQPKPAQPETPTFADPETGFRYAVLTAWARRTPPPEQAARPLPDYTLGPEFTDSVRILEGIGLDKIADVVFEILTDRAKDLAGRELHPLRTREGSTSPQLTRDDHAGAWRAALQRNTPAARRIHFWRLADGSVELSRVVVHDDMNP